MKSISDDDFEELMYGGEYEKVQALEITDQSRWYTYFSQVIQNKKNDKFLKVYWARGSTECQEFGVALSIQEVSPVERTTTYYESK